MGGKPVCDDVCVGHRGIPPTLILLLSKKESNGTLSKESNGTLPREAILRQFSGERKLCRGAASDVSKSGAITSSYDGFRTSSGEVRLVVQTRVLEWLGIEHRCPQANELGWGSSVSYKKDTMHHRGW